MKVTLSGPDQRDLQKNNVFTVKVISRRNGAHATFSNDKLQVKVETSEIVDCST